MLPTASTPLSQGTSPFTNGVYPSYQSNKNSAVGEEGVGFIGGSKHGDINLDNNGAVFHASIDDSDAASDDDDFNEHKTTFWQTYIHLLKGYIGCGVLSLPWAVSQLGVTGGCVVIIVMAYWSSYNCWTVVKLKRYIEQRQTPNTPGGPLATPPQVELSDAASASDAASNATIATNITYPDVGDFLYGKQFQSYIAVCVCVQQLAICTVFLSFIGENLLAVLERLDAPAFFDNHSMVTTLALPAVLSLSFMPNLKSLSPVMAAGTILMILGFVSLGVVGGIEWADRPEPPKANPPQVPLAICAILYSYEGICLVLPIESAMKEPKDFKKAFVWSMVSVAIILALVASLSVLAFGNVTNGSITAFLLEAYRDDPSITWWLMVANTAVSISILLTYPLQLFPALELMGPWLSRTFSFGKKVGIGVDVAEESDLVGFEPLPPLPEHDTASLESIPSQHDYGDYDNVKTDEDGDSDDGMGDDLSRTMVSSVTTMFPEMTMPGDSPLLRLILVLLTYSVAVIIPDVQTLISLAGAVAGSSTALLIPPIMELAWIRHLQRDSSDEVRPVDETGWFMAYRCTDKYLWEKAKSWFLLVIGLIFMGIGTAASIADIVRIYSK